MNQATKLTRIDTHLVMHLEADDFAEGYQAHPETRQPVSCPPRGRKNRLGLWVALLAPVAVVAGLGLWAVLWP